MKLTIVFLILFVCVGALSAVDDLYLNGMNETTYIYRTAKDSLNSYFRDAFSFSMGYKDFSLGIKFLAELPKYSTDQSQLMDELNQNKLSTKWTERYLEFERDNLLLHGGTISESFGSGMVFRAWEDVEFDADTRLDGFLVKYDNYVKLKALYGAVPNREQPLKYDLAYGSDLEIPVIKGITYGLSALTIRTLNPLEIYNQQDVYAGRIAINYDNFDGAVEYAKTALFNNSGANYEGTGINAYSDIYFQPQFIKSLSVGAGYKYYDKFNNRMQDLKTFNYHNEVLADNQTTGADEEGLQGTLAIGLNDAANLNLNYAEGWDSHFTKRMNDIYTGLEYQIGAKTLLLEYGHIEKLDKVTDYWQKELKPATSLSMPLLSYAFTIKSGLDYKEKVSNDNKSGHYEPMLQTDLGMGKLSVSFGTKSWWINSGDISTSRYWVNTEIKYAAFEHTDITIFAGNEAGGKVCRNGVCRFVAPFQGVKLEAATRF